MWSVVLLSNGAFCGGRFVILKSHVLWVVLTSTGSLGGGRCVVDVWWFGCVVVQRNVVFVVVLSCQGTCGRCFYRAKERCVVFVLLLFCRFEELHVLVVQSCRPKINVVWLSFVVQRRIVSSSFCRPTRTLCNGRAKDRGGRFIVKRTLCGGRFVRSSFVVQKKRCVVVILSSTEKLCGCHLCRPKNVVWVLWNVVSSSNGALCGGLFCRAKER